MDNISIKDLKDSLEKVEKRISVIDSEVSQLTREKGELKEKRDKICKVLEVFQDVAGLVESIPKGKKLVPATPKGTVINRTVWLHPDRYVPRSKLKEWVEDEVLMAGVYLTLEGVIEGCKVVGVETEGFREKVIGNSQVAEVLKELVMEGKVEKGKNNENEVGWRLK